MEEKELSEILNKEQLKELKKLINELEKKKIKPLDVEYVKSLRELFKKYESDLIAKKVLPDYLAYAIAFKISQNPELFKIKLENAIKT